MKFNYLLVAALFFTGLQGHSNTCNLNTLIVKHLENHLGKPCAQIGKADLEEIELIQFSDFSGIPSSPPWESIPPQEFAAFPNLTGIWFHGGQMNRVPSDFFKFIPKLKYVTFHWVPGIPSLPADLFANNPHLESFYFSTDNYGGGSTLLTEFPAALFQNKKHLNYVRFLNSAVDKLPEDAFSGDVNLEKLELSQQFKLKFIPANLCRGCDKLETIDFRSCGIVDVHPDAFVGMPNLKTVIISQTGMAKNTQLQTMLKNRYPKVNFQF